MTDSQCLNTPTNGTLRRISHTGAVQFAFVEWLTKTQDSMVVHQHLNFALNLQALHVSTAIERCQYQDSPSEPQD